MYKIQSEAMKVQDWSVCSKCELPWEWHEPYRKETKVTKVDDSGDFALSTPITPYYVIYCPKRGDMKYE